MAKISSRFGPLGFSGEITGEEARECVIPGLWIVSTLSLAFWSGKLIYNKLCSDNKIRVIEAKCKSETAAAKEKAEVLDNSYSKRQEIKTKAEMDLIQFKKAFADSRKDDSTDDTAKGEKEDLPNQNWENFNDVVHNPNCEGTEWLLGNVFSKGGIHLLVGPKSVGKTMLVTQMMDAISNGNDMELFVSDNNNPCYQPGQKVYLYDFEMTYSQLKERNGQNNHSFINIFREQNQNFTIPNWLKHMKTIVDKSNEDITIVVDNITRFVSDITQPHYANQLYDGVKAVRDEAMKRGVAVSFIFIAHTSNDLQEHTPINLQKVAVADAFTTGLDCICAIGPTRYENQKYFKIICSRNTKQPDYVELLQHTDNPYVSFVLGGKAKEADVLPLAKSRSTSSSKKKITAEKVLKIKELAKEGLTSRDIGEQVGLSHTSVCNVTNGKIVIE